MSERICGTICLTTESKVHLVELVHYLADRFFEIAGFEDEAVSRLTAAVREAVNNAIEHGNKMDPEKKVHLGITLEKDRVLITVRDEGEGFDAESVPSPLDGENRLKNGGRGIFFMRKFMDRVEFHKLPDDGTEVIMAKNLPD